MIAEIKYYWFRNRAILLIKYTLLFVSTSPQNEQATPSAGSRCVTTESDLPTVAGVYFSVGGLQSKRK